LDDSQEDMTIGLNGQFDLPIPKFGQV